MKEKTIIAPVSLVLKAGEAAVPPGTPVTLPEAEADSLIARFDAVEVPPEDEDGKPKGRGKKAAAQPAKTPDGTSPNGGNAGESQTGAGADGSAASDGGDSSGDGAGDADGG